MIIILRSLLTHQEEKEQDNGGHATLRASELYLRNRLNIRLKLSREIWKVRNTPLFGGLKGRKTGVCKPKAIDTAVCRCKILMWVLNVRGLLCGMKSVVLSVKLKEGILLKPYWSFGIQKCEVFTEQLTACQCSGNDLENVCYKKTKFRSKLYICSWKIRSN